MLDRRDFEEWWARECARSSVGDPGPSARHWAEFGFFASQTIMRNHVHNQERRAAADGAKPLPALLGGRHGR